MSNAIANRISLLRKKMREEEIEWYLISSEDYHGSEYVADYFKVREYYTGFTGDNAVLIIGSTNAYMWTDGRFFIQAANELEGTGIELMKMGEENVPTVIEFLKANVKENECLAFDGRTVSNSFGNKVKNILKKSKADMKYGCDIAGELMKRRPSKPCSNLFVLPDDVSGESMHSKIERVKASLKENDADAFFLSKLDDIMWLTNIRGNDIPCNPVALSYLFMTLDKTVIFLQKKEVSKEIKAYFDKNNVEIRDYDEVLDYVSDIPAELNVLVDENNVNFSIMSILENRVQVVKKQNPTEGFKAVKNETELKRLREILIEDSAAVTRFIYWLKKNIGKKTITEVSAAEYLDNLRSKIPGFLGLSFPTISGYNANAAMMHYEATKESHAVLSPMGALLVDSGGQYMKGTTDITRTIVLGEVSDKFKCHFSKVAAGMLSLANAKFLYGCTGRNVDILARLPLWEMNMDYKCGTGHGVGYILNVHEGPQSIRWKYVKDSSEAVLEEGMIITDEPGVYIENEYGIRTENEILCRKGVKNSDGQFMYFENLTYTPIDREALDKQYLSKADIENIDAYHQKVYELTKDYMNEEERTWLYEVTRPL